MPEKSHEGVSTDSSSGKTKGSGGKLFLRVILPTALFIIALGVIGVAVQIWRAPQNVKMPAKGAFDQTKPLLEFPYGQLALWNREALPLAGSSEMQTPPILQMERYKTGYFDFAFKNTGTVPAVLGLEKKECDCSNVKVCLLDPQRAKYHTKEQVTRSRWTQPPQDAAFQWQELQTNSSQGVTIPPGKGGLLRLTWRVRKEVGKGLLLGLHLWSQPQGQFRHRKPMLVGAAVMVTNPVRCLPERLPIGLLESGKSKQARFFCWSTTRDQFDLEFPVNDREPNIQCRATKLTAQQCRDKEKNEKLAAGWFRSAYDVTVTIYEDKDGRQLDTGPIYREVPMLATANGESLSFKAPRIEGLVKSPVTVGSGGGHSINLSYFKARNGKTKRERISAPSGYRLKYLKHRPVHWRVDLNRIDPKKQPTADIRENYEIIVTVPANQRVVPVPDDAVILLEATVAGAVSRRVRIPVRGTVTAN